MSEPSLSYVGQGEEGAKDRAKAYQELKEIMRVGAAAEICESNPRLAYRIGYAIIIIALFISFFAYACYSNSMNDYLKIEKANNEV